MGTKYFIAVGVFSVELLAYQVSMVCAAMWPRFDSQTRRLMWVEFVGSLLCTERFSLGTPVSPLLKNHDLICVVNFNLQCPRLVLYGARRLDT